ncbi:protein IQ-DOMAIN 1-like protein [Carex littledalei]|uniref:Protein IQ-DOMAIN 1-like protein n=1 Tax=Carex littledalei TaxID=544730 RepID=A0A833VHU3_9POAL|nr:protein IQ-DOMAIN 1-like protein [Carex littledalei]
MGGSGQWIKSIMSLKKPNKDDQVFGANGKGRKWKLWRSSSGSRAEGYQSASEASETSSVVGPSDAFNAALAAVARAPARDFKILRQEWAAIRIQTAFRAFLARRALRALKAIVRIQALVRGRQVRKQAAITLKCMHALVRVQARVRARRAQMSAEGLEANDTNWQENTDTLKDAQERWCASRGTLADVKTKLQMKQEGAIKRERALSYALSQLQKRSMQSTRPPSPSTFSRKTRDIENGSCDLTWLDRWMATKPWEDQESGTHSPDSTHYSRTPDETHPRRNSHHSDAGSIKIKQNNVTTRVSVRPPLVPTNGRYEAQAASSSEMQYTGSSSKSSPVTPASKNMERGDAGKPSYMNATKAVKARQEAVNAERRSGACRQASGDLQYFKRVAFTSVNSDIISAASNNSCKGRSSMRRSFDKENYLY